MTDPAATQQPEAAPAETGPRSVRVKLTDNYGAIGYWYLRAENGHWICTEKLPGFGHGLKEGDDLKKGIETLIGSLVAFCLVKDEQFKTIEKQMVDNPDLFERKGFRPGYSKKRLGQMRADYAKVRQGYPAAIRKIVAEAASRGWPEPTMPEIPWKE